MMNMKLWGGVATFSGCLVTVVRYQKWKGSIEEVIYRNWGYLDIIN